MQKLSDKIKVMLENNDDHILWMNLRFDLSECGQHNTKCLKYIDEPQKFSCVIDFPPNDKYYVSFDSETKFGSVSVTACRKDVDEAWHDSLREFRTQTLLTQCDMIVASDHLVNVCNHFLKSDESFSLLIIKERI